MAAIFLGVPSFGQTNTPPSANSDSAQPPAAPEPRDKRLFGIIPNYRTSVLPNPYKPISAKEKFKIGRDDVFDRGTVVLAAAFAGEGQLSNSDRSFGQGAEGYGHYFITAYADLAIGNMMTESVFPTILHQDPRYFRRSAGSGKSRFGYAVKQIFWTHTDSGGTQFNYSEILGNSTAVAISTAYYPEGRDAGDAVSKLGTQIGVDMLGNVLKEFWPDIHRKLSHGRVPDKH
jgi:hypothetical protein